MKELEVLNRDGHGGLIRLNKSVIEKLAFIMP